ncbi:hypothetical protein ACXR0O_23575 [Verrucomicrobiota bacterium sgz303538]
MINYPDGKEIQIGDAVLLHHRTYTGVIRHIIESPAEMEAWGLDEPGLMIDTSYGGFVFYPKWSLTDQEVVFASKPRT